MADTDSGESGSGRRRRPASIDYKLKVEALRVVDPFTAMLARWSPRVAYLRGIANRATVSAPTRAASLAEAQTLLEEIRRAQAKLTELVKDRPADVSSHSRIVDAKRSLDALDTHLSEALLLLARW
jgi:hypothetical protein